MRLFIELSSEKDFVIPIHYNYYVQSFLYKSISPKLARILHDHGFPIGKRKFRLFTFSRILGQYQIRKNIERIFFASPFRIVVSSAMKEFVEEIAEELIRREEVRISYQNVHLNSVEVSDTPIRQDKLKIKMLSPVTIYSTLSKADGGKKTYYYSPFENEFSQLISGNARKKFRAFYEKEPNGDIQLTPLNVNKSNEKIISYKGTVIKGWMGIYELSGDQQLMKLAYDAGLGGKNSQGFGCFEVLGRKNFRDED